MFGAAKEAVYRQHNAVCSEVNTTLQALVHGPGDKGLAATYLQCYLVNPLRVRARFVTLCLSAGVFLKRFFLLVVSFLEACVCVCVCDHTLVACLHAATHRETQRQRQTHRETRVARHVTRQPSPQKHQQQQFVGRFVRGEG